MSWSDEWEAMPWYAKILTYVSIEVVFWIVVGLGIGLYGLISLFF